MRKTFGQVLVETRQECAENAWARARQASRMRHLLIQHGQASQGRLLSQVKLQAIQRVVELAGEQARITRDSSQPSCVLVRFRGNGLHVPCRLWPVTPVRFRAT